MRRIAVFTWLWLLTGPAAAALLSWIVTGGTFNDGGMLTGTFVQDSTSNAVTNWNLSVAGGGAFFPARSYTPANSTFSSLALSGNPVASLIFSASDEAFRELRLTPVAALKGSAATVNLDTGFGNNNVECFNCSPFRTIAAGSLALSAQYSGDANYAITRSSAVPLTTQPGAIVARQPVPVIGWPAVAGLIVAMAGWAALKRRWIEPSTPPAARAPSLRGAGRRIVLPR